MVPRGVLDLIVNYLMPGELACFFIGEGISCEVGFTYNCPCTSDFNFGMFPGMVATHISICGIVYRERVIYDDLIPASVSREYIRKITYDDDSDCYYKVDLRGIEKCVNLKCITFPACSEVIGMEILEGLGRLKELSVRGANWEDCRLLNLPNLRKLWMAGSYVPEKVANLNGLVGLRYLCISCMSYEEENHEEIDFEGFYLENLRVLKLYYSGSIVGMPVVNKRLKKVTIFREDIGIIAAFPGLGHLELHGRMRASGGLVLNNLRSVRVISCSGFDELEKLCPNVEYMKIDWIGGDAIVWEKSKYDLGRFKKLRKMRVRNSWWGRDVCCFDLSWLDGCSGLEKLWIGLRADFSRLGRSLKQLCIEGRQGVDICVGASDNVDVDEVMLIGIQTKSIRFSGRVKRLYVKDCPDLDVFAPWGKIDGVQIVGASQIKKNPPHNDKIL